MQVWSPVRKLLQLSCVIFSSGISDVDVLQTLKLSRKSVVHISRKTAANIAKSCLGYEKIADFSKSGSRLCNRLFIPDFLFDFCSVRGSTDTLYTRSNMGKMEKLCKIIKWANWLCTKSEKPIAVFRKFGRLCNKSVPTYVRNFSSIKSDTDGLQMLIISRKLVAYISRKFAAKITKNYLHDAKIANFSKTKSRNMAKTCAINFYTGLPIRLL